ncbi:hypothetical protein GOV04_01580 [Candidatus Woesearchaeota archaeon]|nr:hypothetical protein [Candidatus Woesearchaeota archaeon]
MTFTEEKKEYLQALQKPDSSKQGHIDKEILPLVDTINKLEDYYTTSSCAGRIILIEFKEPLRKDNTHWHYTSHQQAKLSDIQKALQKPSQFDVWLKVEGAILHVCAKDLDSAQILLNTARACGFKRSGIMSVNKRIMLELTATEMMDCLVKREGKIIIPDDYLKIFVEEANKKLSNNTQKVARLHEKINKLH